MPLKGSLAYLAYTEINGTGEIVAAVSTLVTVHDILLKRNMCGCVLLMEPALSPSPVSFLLLIW